MATDPSSTIALLDPPALWRRFIDLSQIPRASGNEAAAAAWAMGIGQGLGCEAQRDNVGNVLLRKPATRDGRRGIVLQAHLDMVCEKNEGTIHDFATDPIHLVHEGGILRARGTTLGADNGIGVAAALAVLEARDIGHGPLEILLTVDEETGLTGANGLGAGWLRGEVLLNLDSEEEGVLTIGCAGGLDTQASRGVTRGPASSGKRPYRIKVAGLRGGHSGVDIDKGRGNAIRVLAGALAPNLAPFGIDLASFNGGSRRNAIAREAQAVVWMHPGREEELRSALSRIERETQALLGEADPSPEVAMEAVDVAEPPMSAADARCLLDVILELPHGVLAMSQEMPGIVETSTNLGVVETRADGVELQTNQRSFIEASKNAAGDRVRQISERAGFVVQQPHRYPGWRPNPHSPVVRTATEVHRRLFGREPKIESIHAGLECGVIGAAYPNLDMISFGPTMKDAHSPDERIQVASVSSFWRFLVALIEAV